MTVVNATQTTMVHANHLVAPAMVMAWNSEDLVAVTASRSVEIISHERPTAQTTVEPAVTVSSSPATQENHLPQADTVRHKVVLAVCIAVGCLVGIGIVAALIAFVLVKRRHRKAAAAAKDLPPAYEARRSESSEELPEYVAGAKMETFDVK